MFGIMAGMDQKDSYVVSQTIDIPQFFVDKVVHALVMQVVQVSQSLAVLGWFYW